MEYQSIKSDYWDTFFKQVSKAARGRQMLLEVVGKDLGSQVEKDWSLFDGISYDRVRDILYINMKDLEHPIVSPREVLTLDEGSIRSISVKDKEGLVQIMRFRDPILIENREA